jgi:hypothetical protein
MSSRFSTEIEASEMKMLGSQRGAGQPLVSNLKAVPDPWENGNSTLVDWTKDLPF